MLRAIRAYLEGHGFLEVETPVLQSIAGGAMAQPFVTHHRVLDVDLFLRISLELYLKRLLVGGLERVYEIGRNFRNEGIDRTHNPEFTMLEVYQAYGDYFTMMDLTRDLVRETALAVRGTTVVPFRDRELDLGGEWKRITVLGSVSEAAGEEVTLDRPDLAALAERHDVHVDPAWGPGKVALEMYEKLVEPTLFEPTFVMDFPREVSPLARPHRDDPALTEHVDPVIGGVELGTAYSELTDPEEQRAKFELQRQQRAAGDEEAHPVRRGVHRGAGTGNAARRWPGRRDGPAAHGADRCAVASRPDPVSTSPPGGVSRAPRRRGLDRGERLAPLPPPALRRWGRNSSQVAVPWITPRTYLHVPYGARGPMNSQTRHDTSGLGAGR